MIYLDPENGVMGTPWNDIDRLPLTDTRYRVTLRPDQEESGVWMAFYYQKHRAEVCEDTSKIRPVKGSNASWDSFPYLNPAAR